MPKTIDFKRLRDWWSTPLGKAFLASEGEEVRKLIPLLFGYHAVLLGEAPFIQAFEGSPILHRIWMYPKTTEIAPGGVVSRYDKWPIISDGVDLVYLAHCLEFVQNPHEVLREVYRALRPEGHVVIANFNPWSSWGLWRWFVRYIKRTPWDGHFISLSRLKDWLALLGFDVVQVRSHFFKPPVTHVKTLERLNWLEKAMRVCCPFWSGGYVLLARKRVLTLTPIRPAFREIKVEPEKTVEPVEPVSCDAVDSDPPA